MNGLNEFTSGLVITEGHDLLSAQGSGSMVRARPSLVR
jgi:hypothetical protein